MFKIAEIFKHFPKINSEQEITRKSIGIVIENIFETINFVQSFRVKSKKLKLEKLCADVLKSQNHTRRDTVKLCVRILKKRSLNRAENKSRKSTQTRFARRNFGIVKAARRRTAR